MILQYGIASGLAFGLTIVGYGFFFRWAKLRAAGFPLALFYILIVVAAVTPVQLLGGGAVGQLTFGSGVLLGSLSSAVAALAYACFVFWYNSRVDDGLLVKLLEDGIAKVEAKGLDAAEAGKRIRRLEKATQPATFALQTFLGLAILGAISSLGAAVWIA